VKQRIVIIFLISSFSVVAQHEPYVHYSERTRDTADTAETAKTLQQFFRQGEFFAHARNFFMATDNAPGLTDYYANAFGMGIGYETGKFKNVQLGISGFFIYNIISSDLGAKDPSTGLSNRYELGLFDIENPGNLHDLDRLEDLYLRYTFGKSFIKFGKQHIKTPFINPQDGRMRPTLAEGAVLEFNHIKKLKIDLGWLYGISPRSTVRWYGIGRSIGVYQGGVNPDGTKSGYSGNLASNALVYIGLTQQIGKYVKVQAWDQYVDNVFNTSLLQMNYDIPVGTSKRTQLVTAIQSIYQRALHNGGNQDQSKTYMLRGNEVLTWGARIGAEEKENWSVTFNYNHIGGTGRYLMPREWGRDPFFTFMPRERNEGLGAAKALNVVGSKTFKRLRLKTDIAYGHYYLPDVKNTAINKYGMPSYSQLNIDIRHVFTHFFKGLELQLLYVYKSPLGNTYAEGKYEFNKVNMSLYNLVLNYHF
jgi:hypothetical protein